MSDKPTYNIQLSNGSTAVLRHLLNQPGWTKTITEFVSAAQLLAEVVPESPEQPDRPHPVTTPKYQEALIEYKANEAAWAKGLTAEFTINEKQRDLIKTCLKSAVDKQNVVPSKPAFDLFSRFGITE